MINDLTNSNGLQNINQHLGTSQTASHADTKEVMVALSKIQVGDILKGQLVLENEKAMLKLESGLKLLASLPEHAVFNKALDFLVVGKERQHLILELAQPFESEKSMTSITDQAVHELGIKDTPEMRQIIEQFIGKQLPLIKEQLIQLLHFSSSYDIPTETLTNLVSQKQMPEQEELELLTNLKKEGVKAFMPTLEQMVQEMSLGESSKLTRTFFKLLTPNEVNDFFKLINLLPDEEVLSRNGDLKGIDFSPMLDETRMKNSLETLQQLLKQPNQSSVDRSSFQDALNKFLDELLQVSDHDQINKLNKALLHESFLVHLKAIRNEKSSEIEKMTEMDSRLRQIIKVIEEVTTESSEKPHLQTLENVVDVLDKYKMQGQYVCFPLQIKEQNTTGELYFFKPKKQKGMKEQGLYVVLALNMPALNKVEVHLVERFDHIHLKIKVENEVIKDQLKLYEDTLLESMKSSDVPIESVVVELFSEKKQSLEKGIPDTLCHLDIKV